MKEPADKNRLQTWCGYKTYHNHVHVEICDDIHQIQRFYEIPGVTSLAGPFVAKDKEDALQKILKFL